jgi:hypothetical protein
MEHYVVRVAESVRLGVPPAVLAGAGHPPWVADTGQAWDVHAGAPICLLRVFYPIESAAGGLNAIFLPETDPVSIHLDSVLWVCGSAASCPLPFHDH